MPGTVVHICNPSTEDTIWSVKSASQSVGQSTNSTLSERPCLENNMDSNQRRCLMLVSSLCIHTRGIVHEYTHMYKRKALSSDTCPQILKLYLMKSPEDSSSGAQSGIQFTRHGGEGRGKLLLPHGAASIGEIRKVWKLIVMMFHNTVNLVNVTELYL